MAAETRKTSSTCVLIHSGRPALFQLKPKKEEFGTLTRKTVGEKNVNKPNKTILLVGETGAGKSSLINALINYSMGVKWEDEVWFQIVEEERSQTESQTPDVIVYEIFDSEDKTLPYSLTIIDTPGYGKSKGINHDEIVRQTLVDLFRSEDGVHEVHAVGLVMKAGENQLSERLKYVFNSVMSLLGKGVEKNTIALITHSGVQTHTYALKAFEDANIKCAKNKENQPVHFLFNNQQNMMRKNENEFFLLHAWKITNKELRHFTDFLGGTSPQQLEPFVLNECVRLTACIQNLQERIELTELKQGEIEQFQHALKNKTQEKNKFTVEIDEVYKEKRPINGGSLSFFNEGAVCCTVCEENCHYPGCTLACNPESCEVMKGGYCTSCTNRCPVSYHVKEKWRYVTSRKRVQGTKEEIKRKYENKRKLLKRLDKVMETLNIEKSELLDESYQHVVRLEQNVASVSTYVHLDFLIEKMKDKGDTEKVQKLKEMRRVDERPREALRISSSLSRDDSVDLLRSGCPAVYQLRPKKQKIGTLTRMTVGEKNPTKPNKTILLVGETGTGKSTLINALFNYSMGVKWEDEVWFQIVEDEKRSQTESQTSDVIVYEIFGFEGKTLPYSLTIIDTPGYGDTRGIECDDMVIKRLFDLFRSQDGVHEVHAVGLVMKASVNRLCDRLMYIFDSVMSLFGKDLEKNIVALITHSDGRRPQNIFQALEAAKIKCAKNEKNQPVHFMFDSCQHDDRTEEEKFLKQADEISERGMREFTAFLEKTAPQKLEKTVEVLNERITLTACIPNLQDRIKLTELKQTEIRQIQEALKKHETEMMKNEKFTLEVDEVYKDKEPIDGGRWGLFFYEAAVSCTFCEENCHYPGCTVTRYPQHCKVMKYGCCTVCTGKCLASDHVKEKWKYVTKTRKVQRTIADVKQKYEKHKAESQKKVSLLENLEKEMKQLTAEKSQLLDESYQHVVSLEQIALKADSVSTFVHLDFLIEKMKEEGDTEKVQKLEEMRSRVDERTRNALQYTSSVVKRKGNKVKESVS